MTAKKQAPAPAVAAKPAGRSLVDFRAEHDKSYIVPKKIREALDKLGNTWQYELEFLRFAGVSTNDLAAFREQFLDHIVSIGGRTPRRIWTGSKDLARKMREMAG